MARFTMENTDGFSADDIEVLNAAFDHLKARAPDIDEGNISDAVSNAWTPEADARQIERRAARALGIDA